MTLVDFANLLVAAVLLAGIYAVMSVGMTVIYGVMKIVNLAHAGFLALVLDAVAHRAPDAAINAA